jgi:hypothetical protein
MGREGGRWRVSTHAHALAGSGSTHGTTDQSGAGENRMEVRSINPWGVGVHFLLSWLENHKYPKQLDYLLPFLSVP